MKETKRARMPSPATVLALIALAVAIGGTAWAAKKITAKNLASNAVTTKKIKNSAVTEAKLGDGAVTTAKLANGAATAAKTGLRWALVDGNGTILAQSGGISLAFYNPPGDYYLSFGSSQAGKSIQVTPAFRDGDSGYGEAPSRASAAAAAPEYPARSDPTRTAKSTWESATRAAPRTPRPSTSRSSSRDVASPRAEA